MARKVTVTVNYEPIFVGTFNDDMDTTINIDGRMILGVLKDYQNNYRRLTEADLITINVSRIS